MAELKEQNINCTQTKIRLLTTISVKKWVKMTSTFNKLYIIVSQSYIYMIHVNTISMQKQLGLCCKYFPLKCVWKRVDFHCWLDLVE